MNGISKNEIATKISQMHTTNIKHILKTQYKTDDEMRELVKSKTGIVIKRSAR